MYKREEYLGEIFCGVAVDLESHAALLQHFSHVCLNYQAAKVGHNKLEKEVAVFLSKLKTEGLSERKNCFLFFFFFFFCTVICCFSPLAVRVRRNTFSIWLFSLFTRDEM